MLALLLLLLACQPGLSVVLCRSLWLWRRRSHIWARPNWRPVPSRAPRRYGRSVGLIFDTVLTGCLFGLWSALALLPVGKLPLALALGLNLLILATIDLRWLRLPDRITLPLILLGPINGALNQTLLANLATAGLVALCLLLVREGFWRSTGKDGLGLGDVKLATALGAWLGPDATAPTLLVAALIGIAVHFILSRWQDRSGREQPFGPSLALAFWIGFLCQTSAFLQPWEQALSVID